LRLSQDDITSLLAALKKRALRGLGKLEHEHLSILAQTVFEVRLAPAAPCSFARD